MKERLTKIFSRYCDLDKAATRYKMSYGASAAAWTIRLGVLMIGASDIYGDVKASGQEFSLEALGNTPGVALKASFYGAAWAALTAVRWGGALYGSIGLTHKKFGIKAPTL